MSKEFKTKVHHQRLEKGDDKRKSVRTIVVLEDGDFRHVGIAKCDRRDQFCRKTGRTIAYGRAIHAYNRLNAGVEKRENERADLTFTMKSDKSVVADSIDDAKLASDMAETLPEFLFEDKPREEKK